MANAAMLPILLIYFLRLVMAHRLLLNEKEAEVRVPAKSAKERLTWMLPAASLCSAMLAASSDTHVPQLVAAKMLGLCRDSEGG